MSSSKPKANKKVQNKSTSISIVGDTRGNIIVGDSNVIGYTPEKVAELINQINKTFKPKPFDGRCPYKGLDVFEEDDADLFFGREKLVKELVERVHESRAVFITGPSGSGKSSLVRAGLIHALKQEGIKNSSKWLYETIKPGRNPLEALAFAFSRLKSPELGKYFSQNVTQPNVIDECAESVLSERKDQRLVLFIDQFEEIFTQVSKEIRESFIQLITYAVTKQDGRVIILFSMRSDFIPNCATYPELNTLLNKQFIQIGAMQAEELVSAIAQPALRVGLRIDPDLIAQIINDMKGEPGALPLMQFALKDLFDDGQSKGGVIALTLDAYLGHGGIQKSLERHADAAFGKLEKHEQELARSIFSGLIEIGRGTQDTRRTALFEELIPANTNENEVEAIVQKLADARLVTTDEQAGKDTITISHEKLIDAWPWLKKLVNENREVIALQNEINSDAKEWEEHKRDTSYLYSGARLLNADEQVKKQNLNLNQLSKEFVKAGQTRKRRSQGFLFSGISVIVIISIIASVLFRNQSQDNIEIAQTAQAANTEIVAQKEIAQANAEEAQRQAEIALARQLAAQAQSIDASRESYKNLGYLLALQSLKMYPSGEAAQVLLNYNPYDGIPNLLMEIFDEEVTSVAFSPNSEFLLVKGATMYYPGGIAGTNRIDNKGSYSFSPDGKYVISIYDSSIRVWETDTGKEIAQMDNEYFLDSFDVSSDFKYVVTASALRSTINIWEISTKKKVESISHDTVVSVAFSPDNKYIVSSGCESSGCSVRVWETLTGQEVAHMKQDTLGVNVAFSPDGNYVISLDSQIVHVWETSTWNNITNFTHEDLVTSFAISPDSKKVVSGSIDRTARVWEITTGLEISRMTHESRVTSVAFSPDGKYVISGSSWDIMDSRGFGSTARVWDASTKVEVARINHGSTITSVSFSPNGKYVVSAGCDIPDYSESGRISCKEGSARVWLWQSKDLIENTCENLKYGSTSLTNDEWKQYIGDVLPYQPVCENLPIEPEPTATP